MMVDIKEAILLLNIQKKMIDGLNVQYMEGNVQEKFKKSDIIKSLTFYDGMVFIEKRKKSNKSIDLQIFS